MTGSCNSLLAMMALYLMREGEDGRGKNLEHFSALMKTEHHLLSASLLFHWQQK